MDCGSREEHYAGYDIDNDCTDGIDDVMDGFGEQVRIYRFYQVIIPPLIIFSPEYFQLLLPVYIRI